MSHNPYEAPKNRDEEQRTSRKRSRFGMLILLSGLALFAGALLARLLAPVPQIRALPPIQVAPEDVTTIGPESQP